jgi:hypothetical protein
MGLLGEDIEFFKALIVSPIAAALYCVVLLFIFFMLMLIESFSKILTSLIVYNELPKGAENPADAILMFLVSPKA